jgi:hypothetical protein
MNVASVLSRWCKSDLDVAYTCMLQAYVSSVFGCLVRMFVSVLSGCYICLQCFFRCFRKCFICLLFMLQLLHVDVSKINRVFHIGCA